MRVYVNNCSAPLLYVCPTQVNLLVPGNLKPSPVPLFVVRQGVRGPDAAVTLVPGSPAVVRHAGRPRNRPACGLFPDHRRCARPPGRTIIVYAAGLGPTEPNPAPGEIPNYPAQTASGLAVSLDGVPLPGELIKYAGVTPGSAGVYQINLLFPASLAANPEIRVTMGDQASREGVILPAQPSPDQVR